MHNHSIASIGQYTHTILHYNFYRLHLSSLLKYTELAKDQLTECVTANGPLTLLSPSQKDEVLWFSKMTWNIALEAGDSPRDMMRAFDVCQKVCVHISLSLSLFMASLLFLTSYITCCLMTIQRLTESKRVI